MCVAAVARATRTACGVIRQSWWDRGPRQRLGIRNVNISDSHLWPSETSGCCNRAYEVELLFGVLQDGESRSLLPQAARRHRPARPSFEIRKKTRSSAGINYDSSVPGPTIALRSPLSLNSDPVWWTCIILKRF